MISIEGNIRSNYNNLCMKLRSIWYNDKDNSNIEKYTKCAIKKKKIYYKTKWGY